MSNGIPTRGHLLLMMIVLAGLGVLLLLVAMAWPEGIAARTAWLAEVSPREASSRLATQLRIAGLVNAAVVCVLAIYLGRIAWRGIEAAGLAKPGPPERARRSGAKALRRARCLLAFAGALFACAVSVGVAAWRLADSVELQSVPSDWPAPRAFAAERPPAPLVDAAAYATRSSRPSGVDS